MELMIDSRCAETDRGISYVQERHAHRNLACNTQLEILADRLDIAEANPLSRQPMRATNRFAPFESVRRPDGHLTHRALSPGAVHVRAQGTAHCLFRHCTDSLPGHPYCGYSGSPTLLTHRAGAGTAVVRPMRCTPEAQGGSCNRSRVAACYNRSGNCTEAGSDVRPASGDSVEGPGRA